MANTEDTRPATGRLAADLPMLVVEWAAWSAWTRFDRLPAAAPRLPGVYLAATATALVYVVRPVTAGARVCAEPGSGVNTCPGLAPAL